MEGFLSEFDLPLMNAHACKKTLCVEPAYVLNNESKKFFVQLGMNSKVTAQMFKRKPLNLLIVLDISGSMGAMDGTEILRIEWAKMAVKKTLDKMNDKDMFSLILFNHESKTLIPPAFVKDKKMIMSQLKAIMAEGSTNLETGLKDGFNMVSKHFKESFENRVILISDAGLNTRVTSEGPLTGLVGNFAAEEIGLTAIGLGLNFNQDFVHAITLAKGNNYIFVNSGKSMNKYFNQFDILVSPMAYNFKAELTIDGIETELKAAYGLPMKKDSSVHDLLDVRTFFFASEGGGAMLLEYDLK